MTVHWTPYPVILLVTAAVLAALAVYSWRHRATPAGAPVVVLLASIASWVFFSGVEKLFADLETKVFLSRLTYLGIVSVAPASLVVALHATGRAHWCTPKRLAALAVVPIFTLCLCFTNDAHRSLWPTTTVDLEAPYPALMFTYGPFFWVQAGYSYLLLGIAAWLLFAKYLRAWRDYRTEALFVAVGIFTPWIANAVFLSQAGERQLDLTPAAFAVTGVALSLALLRGHVLFDVIRLARTEITDELHHPALVADMRGRLVYANAAACKLLGVETFTRPCPLPDGLSRVPAVIALLRGECEGPREIDHEGRVFEAHVTKLSDSRGVVTSRAAVLHDVTERKRQEQSLRASQVVLRKVVDLVPHMIVARDRAGRFLLVNRAGAEAYGATPQDLEGRTLREIFRGRESAADHIRDRDRRVIDSGEPLHAAEREVEDREGQRRVYQSTRIPFVEPASGERAVLALSIDITEQKKVEQNMRWLAYTDGLTGLPNRARFHETLKSALATAKRRRHRMGLLFVDVDRFKQINDHLGHSTGDQLLGGIAERLADCVRHSDALARPSDSARPDEEDEPSTSISRLGGDEFTLLLSEISHPLDAARVARRVQEALAEPFDVDGREIFTSASVGIAVYPNDGADEDALLRAADRAMYHAKSRGRNQYQFFTDSMNDEGRRRHEIEERLRRALDRGELSVRYQPVRDAKSGVLAGAEVLLRWKNRELGALEPSEFLPIAEETGLIVPIGQWVLRSACESIALWRAAGLRVPVISVNLSGLQLRHPELPEQVRAVLRETEVSAAGLQIEITESSILADDDVTNGALQALMDMGAALALDDFGTGFSSLSCLRRLPFDCIKIDRSFIAGVPESSADAALVGGVIDLARGLDIRTVAEGVERIAQAEFLRERGCDQLQGYLLSGPVPPEVFGRILENEKEPEGGTD